MTIRLVIFDVDGTLTKHSSIWWRLHEHFGTEDDARRFYDQYFAGEIRYQEWADLDAGLWRGQSLEEVRRLVSETELVTGAKEVIDELHALGISTAILSGGLDIMAENVAQRIGIEYVLTNKLHHEEDVLTGDVEVLVGWGEKVEEIGQIIEHFGVSLEQTAFIGDGRNDLSVFSVVGLSIAFMPEHQDVADGANIAIHNPDLRLILPHVIQASRERRRPEAI